VICFIIFKHEFCNCDRIECERNDTSWLQISFRSNKIWESYKFFYKDSSLVARIHRGDHPFCQSPFFSLVPDFRRALSYLYFHLLSAFLGVLHAPVCTTYLPSRLREASTRCCFLGSPSTAFHVARMGERTRSNPDAAPETAQTHYGFIVRH